MKIKYLGHACFLVSSSEEVRIILDPYEPGGYDGAIAYGPIRDTADIVDSLPIARPLRRRTSSLPSPKIEAGLQQ